MKCQKCGINLDEKYIEESHNVPRYLFLGYPNERKNQADKYPRKYLCHECHVKYENNLRNFLIALANEYAKIYFEV